MKQNLLRFIEKFNIIDKSMEMFRKNFEDYKNNYIEEFNKHFNRFNQEKFKVYVKTISFNLSGFPDCNYEYITVDIPMIYDEKEIGYYNIHFNITGDYEDDYFVTY